MSRKKTIKVPVPAHAQHGSHPFTNQANHEKLLAYLKKRITTGKRVRDAQLPRMRRVDQQVASFRELSVEDRKRVLAQKETGKQLPVQANIPITLMHIDDLTTFFLGIFAPITGTYNVAGDKNEQTAGKAVVTLMNQHAKYNAYYAEMNKFFQAGLKYNISGQLTYWDQEVGNVLESSSGELRSQSKVVWQGNRVKALDMYNTFWDPSADPVSLHKKGEYVGYAEKHSLHELIRETRNGFYANTGELFAEGVDSDTQWPREVYIHPPTYAKILGSRTDGSDTQNEQWAEFLGGAESESKMHGIEVVHMFIWLDPADFGLIPPGSDKGAPKDVLGMLPTELYRISIMNGDRIIEATKMNNIHRWLPVSFIIPNADDMGLDQQSIAEVIHPFQTFISFLHNMHMEASRKALVGTTIYDPSMVNLDAVPEGEVAARIPTTPAARGKDHKQFYSELKGDSVNTDGTLGAIGGEMDLLSKLVPTQAEAAQIAGVDRAIKTQMNTLNQAATRRTQKMARLFDSQAFMTSRIIQYYNILQYNKAPIKIEGEEVPASKLLDLQLEYVIGHGLKALDKEITAEKVKEVIFMLLQNPQAAERIDILGMTDYLLKMTEVDANLSQFAIQPPAEGNPEGAAEGEDNVSENGGGEPT